MRVSAINQTICSSKTNRTKYSKNVTFDGIANAGKLKILFSYGLPCMYSGVEMIDPKKAQKLLKNGSFKQPVAKVVQELKPYEHLITGIEANI